MAEEAGGARLLARGLSVLTALGAAPGGLNSAQIQARTGLAKATLSRILATLREAGFVRLGADGRRYTLGPQLFDLTAAAQPDLAQRVIFRAETQRLADLLERPVRHWRLEGASLQAEALILPFGMESAGAAAQAQAPQKIALDRSAAGTAVLAAMPPERLARLLPDLPEYSARNSDLSLRLGVCAATGFSTWDTGESRHDIAAAVIDASGAPVAALCVASLPGEVSEAERHRIGRQVALAAQKVSMGRNLGPRKRDVKTPLPKPTKAALSAEIAVMAGVPEPDKVGTSPAWDARSQRLIWGDSLGGALNWLAPGGQAGRLPFASLPGAVVPFSGGRAIVASRDGIAIVDYLTGRRHALSHPEPEDPLRRFSVARVGPDGRLWVGTLQPAAPESTAEGRLYAFGQDGKIEKMLTLERGVKGLCWSPDGAFLYLTEAGSQTILRFEMTPRNHRPAHPRRFARHTGAGTPNGITVDAEGCLWAAIYGGWQILRFDPSGRLIGSIDLPVPLPTGLCFFGRSLQELFVTNCRMHVPAEILDVAGQAGVPLRIRVQAQGVAQPEFRMP
ncbi:SMP-30/gluconolactonase/LRE family protein [Pseudoruegeria sp. SHC-113]|uniref:SMP-30/gluconolactonase/LRE family protein n=1 Tax=Pseudoruegeria sp. SHC-113 TaxID=2855439 RepID=UPI0021BB0BFF|nr:SMP-30/gluconolactonase/LRE family protein [Pseudoruegeria sp. SHC-113]MCT8162167.1 SMP-30/gluconolactonase/LRE family protein [Pseudoruegeria sp. SHC-113]